MNCGTQDVLLKRDAGVMHLYCTVLGSHRLVLRTAVLVLGLSYVPLSHSFSWSYVSNPPVFFESRKGNNQDNK